MRKTARRRRAAGGPRVEVAEQRYDPGAAAVDLAFTRDVRAPSPRSRSAGADTPQGLRSGPWTRCCARVRCAPTRSRRRCERLEDHFRRRGHREVATQHFFETKPYGEALVYEVRPGPAARGRVRPRRGRRGPARRPRDPARAPRRGPPPRGGRADAPRPARGSRARGARGGGGSAGGGRRPCPWSSACGPGPRTLVRGGHGRGAGALLAQGAARRSSRLRAGEPYRIRDLAADRAALLEAWRDAGYLAAAVTPEVVVLRGPRGGPDRPRGSSPGPAPTWGGSWSRGLRRTKDEVVRRELLVREGSAPRAAASCWRASGGSPLSASSTAPTGPARSGEPRPARPRGERPRGADRDPRLRPGLRRARQGAREASRSRAGTSSGWTARSPPSSAAASRGAASS